MPHVVSALRTVPEVYGLRPWYHDFVRNVLREARGAFRQPSGGFSWRRALGPVASSHRANQGPKEAVLRPYLERALAGAAAPPRCLELFCADGYYACLVARTRPDASVTGVDRDARQVARARTAARLLDCRGVSFVAEDAGRFLERDEPPYDLVLCAGGLYHLAEPRLLLERLRRRTQGFLVVQSVVTLESEDAGYFVSPAPGWRHGSRFSHAALRRWLDELGWTVLASERNELPGNPRPSDRGSSYFLCRIGAASAGEHGRTG
jgi:2-polyprenyl-3-methyl-5-hydroxy-6-metoxy-1,4-benzoquinol methylase